MLNNLQSYALATPILRSINTRGSASAVASSLHARYDRCAAPDRGPSITFALLRTSLPVTSALRTSRENQLVGSRPIPSRDALPHPQKSILC